MAALSSNPTKIAVVRFLYGFQLVSAVLIPLLRDWGGLDYTRIFFLTAWFMVWAFVLEIPTGALADRFGRKSTLKLAGIVAACGWATLVSTPNFGVFLLAQTLLALSLALVSGSDHALLYDTLLALDRAEEAPRSFARIESVKLSGIVVAALLGSPIAAAFGLTAPALLQVLPTLLGSAIAFSIVEPPHQAEREQPRRSRLLVSGFHALRDSRELRALTLDAVGTHCLVFSILWIYQPVLERAGIGLIWFGSVHSALALAQIGVLAQVDRLESWCGSPLRYLRLSALLPGLAYLMMGLWDSPWGAVAGTLVVAGLGIPRITLLRAHMNHHISSEVRATVLSTTTMFAGFALALLLPLIGVAMDASLPNTLLGMGALTLVVALFSRVRASDLGAPQAPELPANP